MPFYEVVHSYPLEPSQREALAQSITKLHAHTFTTPSIFVNVKFTASDATDYTYYVAGKPRVTATNRIHANVRTGPSRSKADYDKLGAQLEEAWFDAVNGEKITEGKDKGKRKGEIDETERDRAAKELLFVVFYPMIAVRERGTVISEAGKEAEYYKEYLPYFRKRADEGDEEFKGVLEELEARDDLKKLLGAGGSSLSGLLGKVGLTSQNSHQGSEKEQK